MPFRKKANLLSVVTVTAFFSLSAFLILISYRQQLELAETSELARLKGIASTLALQVNGNIHRDLIEEYGPIDAITSNEFDPRYQAIHMLLKKAQDANMIESTIYTMVYSEEMEKFCFGVTSSDTPFWKHAYRGFPDVLLKKYDSGGIINVYTDENGMWLSAFSPIKASDGSTVAILQVDQRFESFIDKAKKGVWKNIAIPLIIAALVTILILFFIRSIQIQRNKLDEMRLELDSLRRELIANVSHDLRTPLASIQGYLETILLKKDKIEPEKLDQYLAISLKNTEKLKTLVDDLFQYSKLESGAIKPKKEPFSLQELCADVVASSKVTAAEKDIKIVSELPQDLPLAYGDIGMIDRVLQNLISNAIKFSDSNDVIHLLLTKEGECLKCVVKDSGPGIDQDELDKVFERFHTKTTGSQQGTGLGLAIVKSVLEAHGSEFSLTSAKNQGTTFSFSLPIFKG